MTFDPKKYLINLKGKEYLPVSARLIWFRQDHPDWSIITSPVEINLEKNYAIFSASILNADGKIIATGTKMETVKDFGDFLEKAETGSVGRALAMCGYGTQFAPELSEIARFADTPQGARFAPRPGTPMNGGGNFNNRPLNGRSSMNGNGGGDRESRSPMPMTVVPDEGDRSFDAATPPATARDRPQERPAPSPVPPSSPPSQPRPAPVAASAGEPPRPVRVREPEPDYSDPGGADEPDSPDDDDAPPLRAAPQARPAEPANLPPVPLGGGDKPNPLGANPMCSAPGCSMRLTPGQVTLSLQKFGKPLCVLHQKDAAGVSVGQAASGL